LQIYGFSFPFSYLSDRRNSRFWTLETKSGITLNCVVNYAVFHLMSPLTPSPQKQKHKKPTNNKQINKQTKRECIYLCCYYFEIKLTYLRILGPTPWPTYRLTKFYNMKDILLLCWYLHRLVRQVNTKENVLPVCDENYNTTKNNLY